MRYSYDGDSVLAQYDHTGQTVAKYEYGPDQLLSLNHQTEGRQYYHFDALGSVASLTRPDASIQARYQYDAWGNERAHAGASFNRFGFTGHEKDGETGLYYFKARFYDPDTGRFLTQDSYLGDVNTAPSLHRYLYAYANPTVYIDLDGYESTPAYKWDSQDDIPNDASYWTVERGGVATYYSADKSAYSDETTYNIAKSLGGDAQTMERSLWGRVKHGVNGAVSKFEQWRRGDASMVAESDSGPEVEPDDIRGQMQAQRQRNIQQMLRRGEEVARENTPDTERVAETAKTEGIGVAVVVGIEELSRTVKTPAGKMAGKLAREADSTDARKIEARSAYRGGSHREMSRPRGDNLDSHHMPDRNADPKVTAHDGPAIQMDRRDHKATSSYGGGRAASNYRRETSEMIERGEYRKAMAREIRDVRRAANEASGDRKKYNEAIGEMLEHARSSGQLPERKVLK